MHFFDDFGRVTITKAADFRRIWGGIALVLRPPDDGVLLPAYLKRDKSAGPCLVFDTLLIDKGQVPSNGEPVLFEFAYRNVGTRPLSIGRVQTSCGCVGVTRPDKPVLPGGRGTIVLEYNPKERDGPFMHHAAVRSNDPTVPLITLVAAGNTDTKVKVSPSVAGLGAIVAGKTGSALIFVHYSGDTPLDIQDVSCGDERVSVRYGPLTDAVARMIWPAMEKGISCPRRRGHSYVVQIAGRFAGGDAGATIEDDIILRTNIDGYRRIRVPVTAECVGPVEMFPKVLAFVDAIPGQEQSRTVRLVSRVGKGCKVVSVDTGDPRMTCSRWTAGDGRISLSFVATGAVAFALSGKSVQVTVETTGTDETLTLELPIYASLSPHAAPLTGSSELRSARGRSGPSRPTDQD